MSEKRVEDQQLENEIVDKGLTAPRVSLQDIKDAIAQEYYINAYSAVSTLIATQKPNPANEGFEVNTELKRLTICMLVLKNGYVVIGEASCVDLRNFDEALGRSIARKIATDKLWPLLGYELRERLFSRGQEVHGSLEETTEPVDANKEFGTSSDDGE